jgi:hypothetical protein
MANDSNPQDQPLGGDQIQGQSQSTAKDHQNEISKVGIIIAGVLLSVFTVLAIVVLIAYWPDKLPESGKPARYENKWFHMNLLDSACVIFCNKKAVDTTAKAKIIDTAHTRQQVGAANDTSKKDTAKKPNPNKVAVKIDKKSCSDAPFCIDQTIQFSTIIMVLVAVAGFLGNMIHISTSFTTFIGARKFKRSWLLWYFIKPFTASALALIVYFAFRAGFLNSNDSGNNLNLYGILYFSAFTGLFTDIATQKLKEIFEVIFKPKENRPNTLELASKPTFTSINPAVLSLTAANDIVIAGDNLDKNKWVFKFNGVNIDDKNVTVTTKLIHINYNLSPDDKLKAKGVLTVWSSGDKPDFVKEWDIPKA